jgi:predicted outer membrane repeat protein
MFIAPSVSFMTVANCNLTGNVASSALEGWGYGGAVFSWDPLTVSNCDFINNSAGLEGGAIHSPSSLTVIDSSFIGNSAFFGGAIFNALGTPISILGSTFSGNTATVDCDNVWIGPNGQCLF